MDENITCSSPRASIIKLNVSGRLFSTLLWMLLDNSTFFASPKSQVWQREPLPNGSIFLPHDPDSFADIMLFFRTKTYPLFFDARTGHDQVRYNTLLVTARLLGVQKLVTWLEGKKYLQVVTVTYFKQYTDDETATGENNFMIINKDPYATSTEFHVVAIKKLSDVYNCPRNIEVHRQPQDCGRACNQVADDMGDEYSAYDQEEYVRTVAVTKVVMIREEVLDARKC